MSSTRRTCVRTGASVLLVLAAFACGEPTAPASTGTPNPSLSRKPKGMERLLIARDHAIKPELASAAIGPAGGTIELPRAGLTLVVPPGALNRTVRITVHTNSRDFASYGFAPHGLVFARPVEVLQTRSGLRDLGDGVVGGYLAQGRLDIDVTGLGHFAELIQTRRDDGNLAFFISHFSGYAFATGLIESAGVDR